MNAGMEERLTFSQLMSKNRSSDDKGAVKSSTLTDQSKSDPKEEHASFFRWCIQELISYLIHQIDSQSSIV